MDLAFVCARLAVIPKSSEGDAGVLMESTPAGMAISGSSSKQGNDVTGVDTSLKPKIISTESICRKFKIVMPKLVGKRRAISPDTNEDNSNEIREDVEVVEYDSSSPPTNE